MKDLTCLENCFDEQSCYSSPLKDVILQGVCTKNTVYPYPNSDSCELSYRFGIPINYIFKTGICHTPEVFLARATVSTSLYVSLSQLVS